MLGMRKRDVVMYIWIVLAVLADLFNPLIYHVADHRDLINIILSLLATIAINFIFFKLIYFLYDVAKKGFKKLS